MQSQNQAVEIIKNRLYFMISDTPPKDIPKAFYFNIDSDLEYEPFYEDFGPLNLSKIWKYTTEVQKIMKDQKFKESVFYHLTSTKYQKNTNAALLICCFMMITHHQSADEAWRPFKNLAFKPFRDASYGNCTYQCTILDCLRGLQYATKLGWFDYKKFNISQYDHYERVQNGDLNWTVPGKFISFSSPYSTKTDKYGNELFTPKDYLPVFKKLGVTGVIRLNTKTYDREDFINNGIEHHDLYFTDGTSPPMEIVQNFLKITQNDGIYAVHCKAGLGRTGSLIGCYAMKHYCFNAADFIGWIRLCRPGSILGPQQQFLIKMEPIMKEAGKHSPVWEKVKQKIGEKEMELQMKKVSLKDHSLSEQEKKISLYGDKGQGQKLVAKKALTKA